MNVQNLCHLGVQAIGFSSQALVSEESLLNWQKRGSQDNQLIGDRSDIEEIKGELINLVGIIHVVMEDDDDSRKKETCPFFGSTIVACVWQGQLQVSSALFYGGRDHDYLSDKHNPLLNWRLHV